jgi:hypothetical protein
LTSWKQIFLKCESRRVYKWHSKLYFKRSVACWDANMFRHETCMLLYSMLESLVANNKHYHLPCRWASRRRGRRHGRATAVTRGAAASRGCQRAATSPAPVVGCRARGRAKPVETCGQWTASSLESWLEHSLFTYWLSSVVVARGTLKRREKRSVSFFNLFQASHK